MVVEEVITKVAKDGIPAYRRMGLSMTTARTVRVISTSKDFADSVGTIQLVSNKNAESAKMSIRVLIKVFP